MQETKLFELARSRAQLPESFISLNYRKETDLLAIRFSNKKAIYSRADMPKGVIYDYDSKDNLVQVEMLDFNDAFPGVIDDKPPAKVWVNEEVVKARRAAKRERIRENRKRKIANRCCKECGQPKSYVCLKHNQQIKPTIFKVIRKKFRYYTRKFYFNSARKLGFDV